jgi:hypothetical protein
MALITDENIATGEDLRQHESGIYEVASAEGIDLSQKIALAQEEIRVELGGLLFSGEPQKVGWVVVTPPLRLWLLYHSIALVYRDAYGSHLNDRYWKKKLEYEALASWAKRRLFETGVGMTGSPIPKASQPEVSEVAANAAAATYWIRSAWVGARGEEGCPSDPVVIRLEQGLAPQVRAGTAPNAVSGWNVYAGTSASECRLQNAVPLGLGEAWTLPEGGLANGRPAGVGQAPVWYERVERRLERG